jgi:prolipoprotein diacylglyceryltransferase
MPLRVIYSIFIAILFATLVGAGISAFYPGPKAPEYPLGLSAPSQTGEGPAFEAKQREFDERQKNYQKESELYNHNVSIISLVAAIATLVVALTLFRRIELIADGLLLGGLFVLVYSIFRAFGDGDQVFRFIVTSVGFLVAVTLGYLKFVHHEKPKKKKRRKR